VEWLEDRTVLSTFLVTSTGDNGGVNPLPGAGTGTLRQAIVDADTAGTGTAANPDLIQFNIPTTDPGYSSTTGAFTVQPLSALPTLTDTAVLDGYTEPGASPNTLTIGDNAVLKIVLSGSQAGAVDGLVIGAGNCTVRGLVIDNFAEGSGLVLNGSGNDVVMGNFIGTDVTGESAAANNIGINSNSSGDTTGGASPSDRNIISGNNSALPDLADGLGPSDWGIAPGNANLIEGNYIGTDRSGTSAVGNGNGIFQGNNETIGGLTAIPGTGAGNVISGNTGAGINNMGNQNVIAGNLIGTTADGLAALGNFAGIHLYGSDNIIGGTAPGSRNIISANSGDGGGGINVDQVSGGPGGAQGNLVEGNYVGTDITGAKCLGGQNWGFITDGYDNTVGGTTAAARNIISAQGGIGIQIQSRAGFYPTYGNVVQGNYIGTDLSGTVAVPGFAGILLIGGAYGNIIGGAVPAAGNLIDGEGNVAAIGIEGSSSNVIQGNLIGTDKTGTVAVGNPGSGIYIDNGGGDIANNNTIGGTAPGDGNTIAFNGGPGADVEAGTGNSILGNSIYANASPGIYLNSPNNADDDQAAPVLTNVSTSGSGTTISGTLQSVANTTFRIEFFANSSMDPSGDGQGQTFLGFATVSTNASGSGNLSATFSTVVPTGYFLSATATNLSTGDTSQFAKDLVVGSFLVTNTNDSGPGSLREAIYDANTLAYGTAAKPDLIAFDIPTTDAGYNSMTGAFTIQPRSALPAMTDTVVLDGYTQPGASPNTLAVGANAALNIVLSGSQAGAVDGLVIGAGNCTVRGLVIDNFAEGSGILLNGRGNDIVTGNFIGTDVTGESAAANNIGINSSNSSGDTIGGPSPGNRNIISGNNTALPYSADGGSRPYDFGIYPGNGDLIEGDYIGTDKNGTSSLGNSIGIFSASNDTVGGPTTTPGAGAGNLISGNAQWGVTAGNQNLVAGNLIGTNATGLAALGNGYAGAGGGGVFIGGNNNTVGGSTAAARNIISGNSGDNAFGIAIENVAGPSLTSGSYNLVEGNYVGTDITGTTALLGQSEGIGVAGQYNTIGRTTAGTRNIISGSSNDGIQLTLGPGSLPSFGDSILGNYIGTDSSGTRAVPNHIGIHLLPGTSDNTIGGTLPGAGNVISGNSGNGITLSGDSTHGACTNNLIQGNLIGADKTGTIALPNGWDGIQIVGAVNNTIGGTAPGAGNTIAFNRATDGVEVDSGTGTSILGNSIFANTGLGIFLSSANNANDNQAAPVLTGGSASSSGTSVSGTLASVASTTFRIEFFANQSLDSSGNAEGQTFLGFATVTTDANGYLASSPDGSAVITNPDTATATFTAANLAAIPAGEGYLTATATNQSTGDSSQFSNYLAVPTSMVLTSSANPAFFGQPVSLTATVSASFSGFGTPIGGVDFVDTTTNTDLGSVALSGGTATLTPAALNAGTQVIIATYKGNSTFLGSSATLIQVVAPSVLILNPTASGALSLSGNSSINVPGNVVVDSNSKTALTESGNAKITAASVQVVGGTSKTGNSTWSPTPVTGAASVSDPLAGLAVPTSGTSQGAVNLSDNSSLTINPGIYTSIRASGNASLTLNPGVYILAGGGLTVTGNASISGSGVTLYNTESAFPNPGGTYGGITLSGNGSFNLTAPTTGPYAGIVLFQARTNTRAISISGNAADGMSGTVYAPAALLYLSGNASLQGAVVVNELSLSGNAASTQAADGGDVSGGDTAGQLLAGNLEVYVNNANGLFTPGELASIQAAVNAVDATVEPYGVSVSETTDPSTANVVVDTGTTSAAGGYANGVLGCYTTASEITLIQGWNWYTGSDATQIGANQYDFQTTVTHELGHALGLGESNDPTSAMYGTLAPGTAIRTLTTADLNIPYDEGAADPQRAAVVPTSVAAASLAPTQEVTPIASVPPAGAANGSTVAGSSSAVMNRAAVSVVELPGGEPASTPLNRQPSDVVAVGLLDTASGMSLPAFSVAVVTWVSPPALAVAEAPHEHNGHGADVSPVQSAPPTLRYPEPAEQPTTRAALPSASAGSSAEPGAAAVDDFFQAPGRWAAGLIRPGTEEGQPDSPAPRDLAAASPLLLALVGTTWAARDEETQSRKPRLPRRG
jgi:hypothetical protein